MWIHHHLTQNHEIFFRTGVKIITHSLESVASRCVLFEHLRSVLMNQWSFIFICDLYLKGCCPSLCTLERTTVLAGYLNYSCWTWHLLIVTIKFEGHKWPCPNMSMKWAVQNSYVLFSVLCIICKKKCTEYLDHKLHLLLDGLCSQNYGCTEKS